MTHEVKLEEASAQLKDLIEELCHGGDVVVTQDSKPVAKLFAVKTPETNPRRIRVAGFAKNEILYIADDFDAPLEDFKDYM